MMEQILTMVRERIDRLLARQEQVLVAIDGSCTAGKSTLAALLAEGYGCTVFHMDDFFLRPGQRTPERLAEIGGNVDYERFAAEVLAPLKTGKPFSYRPFDCRSGPLREPVTVEPDRLSIIEGSYSHHPYFGDPYDLKVFLQVSPEVRRQRILRRTPLLHRQFFENWIPMEQRYFEEFAIEEKADLAVLPMDNQ